MFILAIENYWDTVEFSIIYVCCHSCIKNDISIHENCLITGTVGSEIVIESLVYWSQHYCNQTFVAHHVIILNGDYSVVCC